MIFPALFPQDPRYFYKGTGSRKSRFLFAVANAVICKGDNRHWQANYSSVLGSLAAGGLSNLYYPDSNRNGVGLTFENMLIGIGGSAAAGVIQKFFSKKMTPHLQDQPSSPLTEAFVLTSVSGLRARLLVLPASFASESTS